MFHVIGIFVVLLLRTNPHPEEVLRLLPLVNHLVEEQMRFCNNALSALYSRQKEDDATSNGFTIKVTTCSKLFVAVGVVVVAWCGGTVQTVAEL